MQDDPYKMIMSKIIIEFYVRMQRKIQLLVIILYTVYYIQNSYQYLLK